MRPRIWREDGVWRYSVPLFTATGGVRRTDGIERTWRAAYDRTCTIIRCYMEATA